MAATAAKPAAEKLDPAVVRTALILIVGAMAVIFDTTIVSVALHTLSVKLATPVTTIQWVSTGYLLALGIAVPLSTWGLQRFGGKPLWIFSLAVFLIGSVGSSLAWNVGSLIGWRVVQGLGGGLMLPLMTTLIFQAAGGKSLGRLITYVALPALLGPILGPLIGGAILTHLSWRFMFWVNVPFCVAGILLAWRYLNAGAPTRMPVEELSGSELRVLRYLPTNLTRREIADELSVSVHTVDSHIRRVYAKLGAADRTAAVQRGRELRLL